MINLVKLPTKNKRMFLRVARGHFATSHSHINYYIDVTMQKTRLSEAAEAARELVHMYKTTTIVTPSSAWTAPRSSAPVWPTS